MTELALPEVDCRRTSRRPAWSQLPRAVQEATGRVAGVVVERADPPVASGFTGAFAGCVTLVGGRRVFVKAGAPDQPHVVGALAQEAKVLDRLPAGIPAPELVGFATVDGWSVLVMGVVPGRMPGAPWRPPEVDAAHQACRTLAEVGTPATIGGRDFAHRLAADPEIVATGRALLEGTVAIGSELPAWLPRHREHVGALVLDADGRLDGDTLCHGDLRPDNLLVAGPVTGPLTAVVVDWNWVGRAAPWVDWVGLLPLMAAQGVDTDVLVRTSPLTRDVDPDDLDVFVAVIAAYMLGQYRAAPPPGCTPALREHQLLMAHVFLAFLRRRRRWS